MRVVHNAFMAELPDADLLLTLLVVAEAGSESAAADALGIGQSSVSRRIAALQQASTAPLTQRTAGGTRLTPAGEALLPYARTVRAALTAAMRQLDPSVPDPLQVTLGISHHLVPRLAGALLVERRERAAAGEPIEPDLREAYSAALLAAVREGTLQAAVTLWAPAGGEPGLRATRVGQDRLRLVAQQGGRVIRGGRIVPEAFRQATLLLPTTASTIGMRARTVLRRAGLEPARVTDLSGPAAVRAAVLNGEGVGVTLASYTASEAAAGWLAHAEIDPEESAIDVWLLISDRVPATDAARLERLVSGAMQRSEAAVRA